MCRPKYQPAAAFTGLAALLLLGFSMAAAAEVQIHRLERGTNAASIQWEGAGGRSVVQTSSDLVRWSDQGEPTNGTALAVAAFGDKSFYRVQDLDPQAQAGAFFGLIQTAQGEFGSLMARHRLKTRLWLYKTQAPPHSSPSYTPAEYWRKLYVNLQQQHDGLVRTWSGPLETLGTVSTPGSQQMTIAWTSGSGTNQRSFLLTMSFPYPVNASRSTPPFPSDPEYDLKCTYATPQPELIYEQTLRFGTTNADAVGLVEMAPPEPEPGFYTRNYTVTNGAVRVNLHFREGMPLYQGSPPWIIKTLLLDGWLAPTVGGGGNLPGFSTDSYFSRTLLPGHHNFYEMVLIEPALDPALSEETRRALFEANIRYVYTGKDIAGVTFDGNTDEILYFGFDYTIRKP